MLKNRLVYSLILCLFSFAHSLAQGEKNAIPLKNILAQISQQHDVKFSYIEDEIVVFAVAEPEKKWSLEQKIEYLKKETKLEFKRVAQKYYTIYNNQQLDKPLCGYLLDAETEKGIENALLKIDRTTISVFTNQNGYFELPKVSSAQILVQHQSYQTLIINPEDLYVAECPKFKLQSIIQTLDEVITQRYLATGISKKTDGTVEVKPKKFGILPGLIEPDVLQTMQQVPGIISLDETISNINVRGGTHDQNLFLWNGIRMFQTGHFFGLISAFNPSLAQTISITKNGSSAFFGESVSSLVDISSRTNTVETTNSSVSTNLISAEFYTKLKVSENANLTLSARRSLTDSFKSPTYQNYSDRIFQNTVITDLNTNEIVDYQSEVDFYFYDITAQFQQKIGRKNELNIDVIAIENTLKFNQSSVNLNKNSALEQENFGGTIQWKTVWNAKQYTEFKGYFSSYDLNSSYETLESNQVLDQKNQVLDTGFQVRNSNVISKKITLNTGYQFNEIGITNFDEVNQPFFSRTITNVLLTHVGIAEGIFETENKKTFLKTGVRANYFDKFGFFLLEPRVQFNQALTSALRLEVLGEQKSQTLSQIIDLQQDFLGVEKRRWTLANNSTIPIQKSNQISLGLSFKKNNWLLTLDNFYKKVTGITSSSQGFQNQFELDKTVGNYQVLGSEFLIQKSFNRFYTWLSYSYNDNQYHFAELLNTSFPNNYDITHAISWAGIYEWQKLKLALGTKWHTGRPITTPSAFIVTTANPDIVYNSPNNSKLKDYFQVNFSASKDWKLKEKITLQTSVSILNLLNTKNSLNRFYRVNTADNSVESVDTYSLEMTPNINVKISF
ncbi:TonB-dependent receptor plug domain-containing protein [Flavobacterium sp. J49]|uniref:TonB-dependent receptor n=1 Tax=Flavobacterium sp. J49 TaxID=2718534 RepID=UPI001593D9B5|nr:TonB-dependent receptor plug domain-containing protein [Flavobacterium sp. J49]MBF6641118.1 TonB-dependent receptor plug domain-containing protein [Flavobacterium sp. J49]NIC02365.1 TonB-dependent receptor [Flavobacterium sp. J49]